MDKKYEPLKAQDYAEPCCPLSMEEFGKAPEIKPVPQQRIIGKLDEYMARRDYPGAERHLNYWAEEARLGRDLKGLLLIMNEKIGFYRKTGKKEESFESIERALQLIDELDYDGSISAGTTYTNAATACQNFGEPERAIGYFEKAKEIYESSLYTAPDLLGGLYNNMALSLTSLGRYEEALDLYNKALGKMSGVQGGELEQAITYLNMADTYVAMVGEESAEKKTEELLDKAYDLLVNSNAPEDGYLAFVYSKCAAVFSHYGYFLAANELSKKSEEIYERT